MQDDVSGAQAAIGVIAKALLTGQKAPADARDQVKDNLVAAGTALGSITSYVDPQICDREGVCAKGTADHDWTGPTRMLVRSSRRPPRS